MKNSKKQWDNLIKTIDRDGCSNDEDSQITYKR